VFNGLVQRALGQVSVFADATDPDGEGSRRLVKIGLEQPYRALRVARSFRESHRANPFQLVISNGVCGWPLSVRDPGVPMVQVYHFTMAGLARTALSTRADRFATGRVYGFFDRLASRGKHVVAVSDSVQSEVETYYRTSARVIPNAVDTTLFRKLDRARARDALRLPQDATLGLFVGRPDYSKGFDILLEVAEAMREVTFAVAGRCPPTPDNVVSVGPVPHSQMPLCYSAADFFFLPSRYEGFNLSILEALSCNLPIVVSEAAYPFADEPDPFGWVARSLQPRDFVKGIRHVLKEHARYAPRDRIVARFSYEVFERNWRALARAVIDGTRFQDAVPGP